MSDEVKRPGEFSVYTPFPSGDSVAVIEGRKCGCRACLRERDERMGGFSVELWKMVVCPTCGNKRCPHASDHRNACTDSNEPGQPGSVYA